MKKRSMKRALSAVLTLCMALPGASVALVRQVLQQFPMTAAHLHHQLPQVHLLKMTALRCV